MKNYDKRKLASNDACFWAFQHSLGKGNELIDFSELTGSNSIKEICETLHSAGVKSFTISCVLPELLYILADFEENGYKCSGITPVYSGYPGSMDNDSDDPDPDVIPAILMKEEVQNDLA